MAARRTGSGRMRGVLTRDGIIKALAATGPVTPVSEAMDRDVPTVNHRAPPCSWTTTLHCGIGR